MKNYGHYIIIALVVFIAAMALFEVDRRGSIMYGSEGRITDAAVNVAVNAAGQAGD